jgi:hypothetical protein
VVKGWIAVNKVTDYGLNDRDKIVKETGHFASSPRLDQKWSSPSHLSSRYQDLFFFSGVNRLEGDVDWSPPPSVGDHEWSFTSSPQTILGSVIQYNVCNTTSSNNTN